MRGGWGWGWIRSRSSCWGGRSAIREDGRWQTREVGVNVPRQNGKGEILIARELFGLFELGERLVIHTAHEFKTSARSISTGSRRSSGIARSCMRG